MKLFVVVFLPMIAYIGAGISKILVGTILRGSSPHLLNSKIIKSSALLQNEIPVEPFVDKVFWRVFLPMIAVKLEIVCRGAGMSNICVGTPD